MRTHATNLQNLVSTAASLSPAAAARKAANSPDSAQEKFNSALNQARSAWPTPKAADAPDQTSTAKTSQKAPPKTGSGKGQGKGKSAGNLPRGAQTPVAVAATPSPQRLPVLAQEQDDENPEDSTPAASTAQVNLIAASSSAELSVVAAAGKTVEQLKTPAQSDAIVQPHTATTTTKATTSTTTTTATTQAGTPRRAEVWAAGKTDATEDQESPQDVAPEEDPAAPPARPDALEAATNKPARRAQSPSAASVQEASHTDAANAEAGKDSTPVNSAAAAATATQTTDANPMPSSPASTGEVKTAVHAAANVDSGVAQTSGAATATVGDVPAAIGATAAQGAATSPQVRFAQENHPLIIAGVSGQLLPRGGTMQIQLNPPDMGALNIRVDMRDGIMNATFQTSNDEATHLLSHTLSQLKGALEAQGVSVDKLQVQQMPRSTRSGAQEESSRQQSGSDADDDATQEQQRRQLLRQTWRRLARGDQELDMVA